MIDNLSIVIVSMNLKDDTAACIESLMTAGASLDQIIVVDNASTDDSVEFLKEKYRGRLRVIEAKENKGYAHGGNLGMQEALQQGSRWVLLMNNDTVVAPDFFKELMGAADECGEQYAILGPLILFYSLPEKIWYLGDKLVPGTMISYNPYFMKELKKDCPPIMPVDFLNGCAMMFRSDVLKTVGLWETAFFMYGDEVDYAFRVQRTDYRMACVTTAKMWHKVSAIMKQVPAKTRYLRTRNQIWIYRKYARGLQPVIMFLFTLCRAAFLSVKDLLHRQTEVAWAIWRGWWDGWMKEKGI